MNRNKKQSIERALQHHTVRGTISGWHYNAAYGRKPWTVDNAFDRYSDEEAFGICIGLALADVMVRRRQVVTDNVV